MGPLDHQFRHASQPGHVHAPALIGGARHHLVEKNKLFTVLLHQHLHIAHARQPVERRQLEIVRRKQRATADPPVKVLDHCLRDGEAVKRARAPADLVEDHQALRRGPIQNPRRLRHLHEKCAGAAGKIVARADPREEPVDDAHAGPFRRHEAAGLRQHRHQRGLTDERALASHVWAGDEEYGRVGGGSLAAAAAGCGQGCDREVVGYKRACRQQVFQHRVPTCFDEELTGFGDLGPHPSP